jgi:hypothetical protein
MLENFKNRNDGTKLLVAEKGRTNERVIQLSATCFGAECALNTWFDLTLYVYR